MRLRFFLFVFLLTNLTFAQVNNNWTFQNGKGLNFGNGDTVKFISSNSYEYFDAKDSPLLINTNLGINATVNDCDGNDMVGYCWTNLALIFNLSK